ncbi:MAG: caspase family protein [Pseudomonadota bacterium]
MIKKLAVCIGINDYPGTGSDLYGCVNDANDWAGALQARGFTCRRVLDSEATGDRIREEMTALAAEGQDGDIVVVVFAGHGSVVPDLDGDEADGQDECWCPHDVGVNGVITDDELNRIYGKRHKGVRWIVISDSCNSGTISRKSRLDAEAAVTNFRRPRPRFLAPEVFAKGAQASRLASRGAARYSASAPGRRGPLLLAGCQEDQESMDAWFNGRANGAFTYVALKTLASLPADADYATWFERIDDYLPSIEYPQIPSLYDVSNKRKYWRILAAEGEAASSVHTRPSAGTTDDGHALMNGRALAAASLALAMQATARSRAPKKNLIAEGDSWFRIPIWNDLIDELEDLNFDVTNVATHGHVLENMAFSPKQKRGFAKAFVKMVQRGEPPTAVLLSGGGNDIAGEQFRMMINPKAGSRPGINRVILDEIVHVRLREAYLTLIGAVDFIAQEQLGRKAPIFLHGYCAGVPDGRGYGVINLAGPWLKPYFDQLGYHDIDENTAMVEELLGEFNAMLKSMTLSPGLEHVRYVNFLDLLPNDTSYKKWWNDELHPSDRGFRRLAAKMAEEISSVL